MMASLCSLDRNIRSPIGALSVAAGILDNSRHAITEKHMCVSKYNGGYWKTNYYVNWADLKQIERKYV